MFAPPSASDWSWTRGLRPSRALALEAVRLLVAAFLILNLVFIAFFVAQYGSPSLSLFPHDPKYAGIAHSNRAVFALDQPLGTQYLVFLQNAFTGNLGTSYYFGAPVNGIVWAALPVTFELMGASLLWALLVGGLLGWASASRRFHGLRAGSELVGALLYAIPVFVAVFALVDWVQSTFHTSMGPMGPLLPRVTGSFVLDGLLSGDPNLFWRALWTTALLALPAGLALALPVLHRVRKALEAQRRAPDFGGLSPSRGLPFFAALQASLVPIAESIGILLPLAFGASLFAEVLTGRRGVGWYLFSALNSLDAPLFLGMLLIPSILVLLLAAPFTLLAAFFARARRATEPPAWPNLPQLRGLVPGAARRLFQLPSMPFWVGVALVAIPAGFSLAAPIVAPLGPTFRAAPLGSCTPGFDCPLSPPSSQHPLGIDYFGVDILGEVLWGGVYLLETLLVAVCLAAGLGLVLGLLASPLGRAADLPMRAILGGMAALPVVVLLWLLAGALPLALALGLAFAPVVFRDVRDLAESAATASRGPPPPLLRLRGWAERIDAAGGNAIPGFLARLPRRAAEMALLVEGFAFLFSAYVGPVDWASVIANGIRTQAITIGNPWSVWTPGLLLFTLAAGLLLISDGLRRVLLPESSHGVPVPPLPMPQPPQLPDGGNP